MAILQKKNSRLENQILSFDRKNLEFKTEIPNEIKVDRSLEDAQRGINKSINFLYISH